MIDFKTELKKFKSCLEVEKVDESILEEEDFIDVLKTMVKKVGNTKGKDVE